MLKALQSYTPFSGNLMDWWYGKSDHNAVVEQEQSLIATDPNHDESTHNSVSNNNKFYGTFRQHRDQTEIEASESSFKKEFSSSSDEDYKTSSDHGILDDSHSINDLVRNIILANNDLACDTSNLKNLKTKNMHCAPGNQHISSIERKYPTYGNAPISKSAPENDFSLRKRVVESNSLDISHENLKIKRTRKTGFWSALNQISPIKFNRQRSHTYSENSSCSEIIMFKHVPAKYPGIQRKRVTFHKVEFSSSNAENPDKTIFDASKCDQGLDLNSKLSETSFLEESDESQWSEYTVSLELPEVGDECRESDIGSTISEVDHSWQNKSTKRQARKNILGQVVNESFVDNECFCCQCSVM